MEPNNLALFEGFGIEIEYMIVDKKNLDVLPITDKVIYEVAHEYVNDVERNQFAWSNELTAHVIEIKTNGPVTTLDNLDQSFHREITYINSILEKHEAQLLPSGAHPWMDPHRDTTLWQHGDNSIYQTYHRIFNCEGHGWSNLQSIHLNLPFANDQEFEKLHAACRLLLPLMPALTASTPIISGKPTGFIDSRLSFYGKNQIKVPSISGKIIPEYMTSQTEYENTILNTMYRDIKPYDPEGNLQYEWLNSRAAIARFDRNAIEIRILDTQECPLADIATASAISASLKALCEGKWCELRDSSHLSESSLRAVFDNVIQHGMNAKINDKKYLEMLGISKSSLSAREIWAFLIENIQNEISTFNYLKTLESLISYGNLSERILSASNGDLSKKKLYDIYFSLVNCLQQNELFL